MCVWSYGKFWINTLWCTLVQLLHYILKCIHLELHHLFGPFRCMFKQTVWLISKLLASLMRNYYPKRSSGEPLHIMSKLYDVPVGLVTPLLIWGCVLLSLRSPKGGCCSISDDLSCVYINILRIWNSRWKKMILKAKWQQVYNILTYLSKDRHIML